MTATRSGAEQFATLFGGYFIDALASDAADADKNRRVSVLEAFNAAKSRRRARLPAARRDAHRARAARRRRRRRGQPGSRRANGKDGSVAAILSLGAPTEALTLPDDPKLRQLYEERRELERAPRR